MGAMANEQATRHLTDINVNGRDGSFLAVAPGYESIKERYIVTLIKRRGDEITALFKIRCITEGFAMHLVKKFEKQYDEAFWGEL